MTFHFHLLFYYTFYLSLPLLLNFIHNKRSWSRHYATSREVAESILHEVIGILNWPNPYSKPMGSTQPLTEMKARNLPGGKGRTALKADNPTAIYDQTA
jgi:hypothetical protein